MLPRAIFHALKRGIMSEGSVFHLFRGKDKIEIEGQNEILKLYLNEYIRHINAAN